MASIFRQQYTKAVDGKRVKCKSEHWYIDFKTVDGIRKRVKGFKDKHSTELLFGLLRPQKVNSKFNAHPRT